MVEKSADAFRTIGEMAQVLGVRTHILRYWEEQFPMLKPLTRAGGRRLYRPDDVALLPPRAATTKRVPARCTKLVTGPCGVNGDGGGDGDGAEAAAVVLPAACQVVALI